MVVYTDPSIIAPLFIFTTDNTIINVEDANDMTAFHKIESSRVCPTNSSITYFVLLVSLYYKFNLTDDLNEIIRKSMPIFHAYLSGMTDSSK